MVRDNHKKIFDMVINQYYFITYLVLINQKVTVDHTILNILLFPRIVKKIGDIIAIAIQKDLK